MKHIKLFESYTTDSISHLIKMWVYEQSQYENCTQDELVEFGLCGDLADYLYHMKEGVEVLTELDFIYNQAAVGEIEGDLNEEKYGLFYINENGSPKTVDYSSYPHIPYRDILVLANHNWAYYEGKHYDMQNPDGVENFFDLKYFSNVTEGSEYTK